MVTERYRIRSDYHTGYRVRNYDGGTELYDIKVVDDSIDDFTGPGDCLDLTIIQKSRRGGLIDGNQSNPLIGYQWHSVPAEWQAHDYAAVSPLDMSLPSFGQMAIDTIERSNPSRADADLMTDLAELKDIPDLLRQSWDIARSAVAKAIPWKVYTGLTRAAQLNIMYQFGIAPLIDDTRKVLEFTERVDARVKELNKLSYRKRGLRRTIDLVNDSVQQHFNATLNSQGAYLFGPVTKSTKYKVTGHIRWHPYPILLRRDHNIYDDAVQAVYGNTVDFNTVYNLIPWSWLVDYFFNLGDFISAGRNTVEAYHEPVRLTITRLTETIVPPIVGSEVTMTAIKNFTKEVYRRTAEPQIEARMQFLTKKQTSIIGSLAVLKGPGFLGR
jgi:hypothetical protein